MHRGYPADDGSEEPRPSHHNIGITLSPLSAILRTARGHIASEMRPARRRVTVSEPPLMGLRGYDVNEPG